MISGRNGRVPHRVSSALKCGQIVESALWWSPPRPSLALPRKCSTTGRLGESYRQHQSGQPYLSSHFPPMNIDSNTGKVHTRYLPAYGYLKPRTRSWFERGSQSRGLRPDLSALVPIPRDLTHPQVLPPPSPKLPALPSWLPPWSLRARTSRTIHPQYPDQI
jgi:hypothetical protein